MIVPKTYSKVMVIGQSSWSRDETVFQGDALLADCRVLCATVVGATSSEDFLIYKALVSRREHKSRENGRDESLHNLEWRTLMQMPPPPGFVIFQNSSTRLLAVIAYQTRKAVTLTACSLLPKSACSTSTKSPLPAENSTFFW